MFITCSFKDDGSGRTYTYLCDIEQVIAKGDRVVVMGPDGIEKIVTVVEVGVDQPPFDCKPVLRVHVPEPAGVKGG